MNIPKYPGKKLGSILRQDIHRNFPMGWKSLLNIVKSPGVFYVMIYRLGRYAGKQNALIKGFLIILYFILQKTYGDFYGIHISRHAEFDGGLKISHFGGIFVNPGVVAGKNITLSQGVSIGVSGKGEKRGAPILGNNIYIAPNSILHGKINVGNNVKVGPNSVVFFDIPDNRIVMAPKPFVKDQSLDNK
jgi:serine O-acetyltransferase